MSEERPDGGAGRRRLLGIAAFGAWTLLGLAEAAKAYVSARLNGQPMGVGFALLGNMPWWWGWAALTPVIVWLGRRFRLDDRDRISRGIAIHVMACIAVAAVHLVAIGTLYHYTIILNIPPGVIQRPLTLAATLRAWFNTFSIVEMFTYWGVLGGFYAVDFYERYQDSALLSARLGRQASELRGMMTDARLQALRMELNPHFLFNTLNTISGFVRRGEADKAVTMLARLGDLLRTTLDQRLPDEIALAQELTLLDSYLSIERVRFGDRLTLVVSVDDDALDALVPTFVLQPLVENAVRHGIGGRAGPCTIEITGRRDGDTVVLSVNDTGVGLPPTPQLREGVGLGNTRARIGQLYGTAASLHLAAGAGGGASVSLRVPYRAATSRDVIYEEVV
ncbi:MAG TPA: histidine kinase [Longimicrobiales bacterium]|nr:histidine kinase [Longimicrobiales bacterium]